MHNSYIWWHFYPRPPRGGRRTSLRCPILRSRFLSTPSARRATGSAVGGQQGLCISIHALREEGDAICKSASTCPLNFYPRPPRGGRPATLNKRIIKPVISIHALREEGDFTRLSSGHGAADFYPRPPRGGRPGNCRCALWQRQISIHALREEGDGQPGCPDRGREISIHALREEGDGR